LFFDRFLAGLDIRRALSKLCQIASLMGRRFRGGWGNGNSVISLMRWGRGRGAFRLGVVGITACVNGHGIYSRLLS
jgi:hypothetical protein